MRCGCCIIPADVLLRFAGDPELSDDVRHALHQTATLSTQVRALRTQNATLTLTALQMPLPQIPLALAAQHGAPPAQVYDCRHSMALPGVVVANPGSSGDGSV